LTHMISSNSREWDIR